MSIIVVEDEFLIRTLLVEALSEEGFKTFEAASGDAAVPLLMNEDVQLIVTDINLPGSLDGIGVAQAARDHKPGIPVVFISGRPENLADARVLDHPAVFLQKPFALARLLNDVRRLVDA